jgi:Fe-S-cluster containining protein
MSFLLDSHNIHDKMSETFDHYQQKHAAYMLCQKGCSQCCHKKFSVFAWEAYVIIEYFKQLSITSQQELIWKFNMSDETKCSFLSDGACTIYQARPTICRTQGAAFFLQGMMDVCPLNFESVTLTKNDCLDLDRINYIMSSMQLKFEAEKLLSPELAAICHEQRVELTALAGLLFKIHQEN